MNARLTWLVNFWGFLLLLLGLGILPAYLWRGTMMIPTSSQGDSEAWRASVISATILAVSLCGGGFTLYQGLQSEAKKPSRPLRLPPWWTLAGVFPLPVALGLVAHYSRSGSFFLATCLIAAAVLPPACVLVWMMDGKPGTLTWRRAGVAFVAGGTISVGLALVLELLLLVLAQIALYGVGELLPGLAGVDAIRKALASPGMVVALVGLAVVAPLVEEIVKPLVTLPLLRLLKSPREALLVGAVAGAGFAAMENVIYASAGLSIWAGILVVRALGAAVHPVGTGLVTVGWFRVLGRESGAGLRWLRGYGLAVGIHALWNGGSTLLLALMGARFFGEAPLEVDVLGVWVAGSLLALLAIEGALAWMAARALSRRSAVPPERDEIDEIISLGGLSRDQSLAVWAVVCLLVLLPVGLAVLEAMW
jgi:RsiW-degrading membrane proteinase PrsW (M82 family)